MLTVKPYEFWFATGSQHLYGPETLEEVERNARKIAEGLDLDPAGPYRVVFKQVLTTPDGIRRFMLDANHADECAGVIVWMHTFSPSKMWIGGLSQLKKPYLHFATQFNRDIPWSTIDMDFMNTNQSAHRRPGATATSPPVSERAGKSCSAIGKTPPSAAASAPGCARPSPSWRAARSRWPASATTCARWR